VSRLVKDMSRSTCFFPGSNITCFTFYIWTDLLGALLGGSPGGRVLEHAPRKGTVEVFPSCPRMDCCYTTHAW
jgi:hypothetical protein